MLHSLLIITFLSFSSLVFSKPKVIHVFVALCDNENQGIVPVSKNLGNGQNLQTNLYWGAMYGVKSYFKKSANWTLIKSIKNPKDEVLERCVFKHISTDTYMIADAYDGEFIQGATVDFINSMAGVSKETVNINGVELGIYGNADLINYTGHDGLMDFRIDDYPINKDGEIRDVIILACYSKHFFTEAVQNAKANPLVWSTGLMSPESYTLEYALEYWIQNKTNEQVRTNAVFAYSKFQKCSLGAAKRLLVTGF